MNAATPLDISTPKGQISLSQGCTDMKCYLAGGMKSEWQDVVILECPDIEFIDPRSHGLVDEKEYTAWDLNGIDNSDIVLAYMDESNPSGYGLNLEIGYAYAEGIPIILVLDRLGDRSKYFGMARTCATWRNWSLEGGIAELKNFQRRRKGLR